jgi:hypothetical protein
MKDQKKKNLETRAREKNNKMLNKNELKVKNTIKKNPNNVAFFFPK